MAYTKTTWVTGSTPLSATNMNHIETGVKDAHDLISALWSAVYPVGCYFETSDADFNPNSAWGGTWILETAGQVHVSAGSGYSVSGALTNTSDGGSKDAIIPYHSHSIPALSGTAASTGAHTHTMSGSSASAGAHTHGTGDSTLTGFNVMNTSKMGRRNIGSSGDGYQWTTDSTSSYAAVGSRTATSSDGAHTHTISVSCASAGAHTHNVTTESNTTGTVGSSGNITGANMMPYIIVYRWHRTA